VEVEAVAAAMLAGAREGQAYFDLSTNSPTVVREIAARFAEKGIHVLDAPVSGGPEGARTAQLAIWVGGDKAAYDRFLPVLRSMSDQPFHVGPVGSGSIAKLVHNLSAYMVQTALAEAFTMGVKAGEEAGVGAEDIWRAVRQGALGRRRTFDMLAKNYLPGRFDPPDFALALARKDVRLAVDLGREFDVPMRIANLTLQEMTEAMNRGWAQRDSRTAMLLQEERAGGVEVRIDPKRIAEILEE
jgi:3-hydroxyisobutyrate dehydrogenase-like beta-hydroxyacid dehydrogenase